MKPSPLRVERLLNDVWYAVSMYFADRIKTTLIEQKEKSLLFCVLVLVLTLQRSIEHWVVQWFHGQQSLWAEIIIEYIYMCSRTMAFLMVSLAIDMLSAQHGTPFFWAESLLVPATVLLVGIAVLKYAEHVATQRKYK